MSRLVLVHGAFVDASCWEPLAAELRRRGHTVDTPDLPGRGRASVSLDDHVAAVVEAIEAGSDPVVLVGHSMGGTVVTQVAERRPDAIERLTYVAAFVPRNGESQLDLALTDDESLVVSHGSLSDDGLLFDVPADAHAAAFFSAEGSGDVALTIRPEPVAPLATPVTRTEQRWGSCRSNYIITTRDQAVGTRLQRRMVERDTLPHVELDACHLVQLTHVPQLADLLER